MRTQDIHGNLTDEYRKFLESSRKREPLPKLNASLPLGKIKSYYGNGSLFSDGSKAAYDQSYANADTYKRLDHIKLRRACRNAFHDSSIARAIGERFTNTVVDTGLKLSLAPDEDILKIDLSNIQDEVREWNKRFHLWANSKNVTITKTMSLYQLQRFITFCQQRDNDYFVRFHYNDLKSGGQVKLEVIDPDSVKGSMDENNKPSKTNPIVDGIEYNDLGEEIAYFVDLKKSGKSKRVRVPAFDKRSGLPLMLHGFKQEYATQKRGLPELANIINDCELFKTFTIAQIKTAIIQSVIAMYVKPSQKNDAGMPLEGYIQDQMRSGLTAETAASYVDSGPYSESLTYEAMHDVNLMPGGVGLFSLQAGEDIKAFEPKIPSQQFNKFAESFITLLASAQSMPPEYLLMKFNNSYSASRAVIVMAYRVALIYAQELFTDFLNPLKEVWFTIEVSKGRIQMPGFSDPIMRQAWLNCDWVGPPMINIDPQKEANANKLDALMGATTLDRIAKNRNGSSFTANAKQLSREKELLPYIDFEGGKEG